MQLKAAQATHESCDSHKNYHFTESTNVPRCPCFFHRDGYFLWVEAIAKPFGFNIYHSGGSGGTAKWLSKSFSLDSALILKSSSSSYLEMVQKSDDGGRIFSDQLFGSLWLVLQ